MTHNLDHSITLSSSKSQHHFSIGLLAGVLGMVGNLSAISDFGSNCMGSLHTNPGSDSSMTKRPGAALILLLVGTLLRVYDIWAHIIVPVPEEVLWTPESVSSRKVSAKEGATTTQPAAAGTTEQDKEVAMTVNPVWDKNDVA